MLDALMPVKISLFPQYYTKISNFSFVITSYYIINIYWRKEEELGNKENNLKMLYTKI